MTSPLLGSLAKTIGKAFAGIFLDATLTRDVPGTITDPADPPLPTQVTYACKAIDEEYGSFDRGQGLVNEKDVQVLITAKSFELNGVPVDIEPLPLDRIAIPDHEIAVTIIGGGSGGMPPVKTDPARATWLCRCRT